MKRKKKATVELCAVTRGQKEQPTVWPESRIENLQFTKYLVPLHVKPGEGVLTINVALPGKTDHELFSDNKNKSKEGDPDAHKEIKQGPAVEFDRVCRVRYSKHAKQRE